MKTDSLFYALFQTIPAILFKLLGQPVEMAQGYQFTSTEIKQPTFRLDGMFKPPEGAIDSLLYYLEVQFQPMPEFYWRFFAAIFLHLEQEKPPQNWHAVAIFARRSLDPGVPRQFEALIEKHLTRLYLDELDDRESPSVGMRMIQVIVAPEDKALPQGQQLLDRTRQQIELGVLKPEVLELIETVLFYKFSRFSRQEVEDMFQLTKDLRDEIRKSWLYQEVKDVAKADGKAEARQEMVPILFHNGWSAEKIAAELQLDIEIVKKAIPGS